MILLPQGFRLGVRLLTSRSVLPVRDSNYERKSNIACALSVLLLHSFRLCPLSWSGRRLPQGAAAPQWGGRSGYRNRGRLQRNDRVERARFEQRADLGVFTKLFPGDRKSVV